MRNIAQVLLDVGAVGFVPHQPITFKSGILSPVYVDNRVLPYHPAAWAEVIAAYQATANGLDFDVLAGIALGGVPHSAALGYAMGRPSVFVRKEAKEHGKTNRIEGGAVAGKRALLIEDMITTGGSSLSGVAALREAGATVTDCIAIISYGLGEASVAFTHADVTLHPLTTFREVWRIARNELPIATVDAVENWLEDPYQWKPLNA